MRVVIIGAGVLGASTAFHLTLAGPEVVVADEAHAGRATAAGAGIVSPWSSGRVDPDWSRIADAGARYYPILIQHLAETGETDTGYRRVGALSVAPCGEQRKSKGRASSTARPGCWPATGG
jgi:D-amino-acid dehydrogenase